MATFKVTASVTADVAIEIEANSEDDARDLFNAGIAVSADLINADAGDYWVTEDCIDDIDRVEVEAV